MKVALAAAAMSRDDSRWRTVGLLRQLLAVRRTLRLRPFAPPAAAEHDAGNETGGDTQDEHADANSERETAVVAVNDQHQTYGHNAQLVNIGQTKWYDRPADRATTPNDSLLSSKI